MYHTIILFAAGIFSVSMNAALAEPPLDAQSKTVTVTPDMVGFFNREEGKPPVMVIKDAVTKDAFLVDDLSKFSCFDIGQTTTITVEKQYFEPKKYNWAVIDTPYCELVLNEPAMQETP